VGEVFPATPSRLSQIGSWQYLNAAPALLYAEPLFLPVMTPSSQVAPDGEFPPSFSSHLFFAAARSSGRTGHLKMGRKRFHFQLSRKLRFKQTPPEIGFFLKVSPGLNHSWVGEVALPFEQTL